MVHPGTKARWRVGEKDVHPATSASQWYVFVKLEGDFPPATATFFIVPKDHAAAAIWINHEAWRTDPAGKPGTRNASLAQALAPESCTDGRGLHGHDRHPTGLLFHTQRRICHYNHGSRGARLRPTGRSTRSVTEGMAERAFRPLKSSLKWGRICITRSAERQIHAGMPETVRRFS